MLHFPRGALHYHPFLTQIYCNFYCTTNRNVKSTVNGEFQNSFVLQYGQQNIVGCSHCRRYYYITPKIFKMYLFISLTNIFFVVNYFIRYFINITTNVLLILTALILIVDGASQHNFDVSVQLHLSKCACKLEVSF